MSKEVLITLSYFSFIALCGWISWSIAESFEMKSQQKDRITFILDADRRSVVISEEKGSTVWTFHKTGDQSPRQPIHRAIIFRGQVMSVDGHSVTETLR